MQEPIAIITGPTATGKSSLALEYARAKQHGLEIVNADSLLFYRELDIGTAKPTREELSQVPHHLIDIRDPSETFTAGDFYQAAQAAFDEIHARGKRAIVVGGSGFYLKALLHGLWDAPKSDPELRLELERLSNEELARELALGDPEAARKIHLSDRYRHVRALEILRLTGRRPSELEAAAAKEPDPRFSLFILDRPNEELHMRISKRTREMLDQGLIEEFERVREKSGDVPPLRAVGYAQVRSYLAGELPEGRVVRPSVEGLCDEIELATRQLVKRQRTWFRNNSPEGTRWFHPDEERKELLGELDRIYR